MDGIDHTIGEFIYRPSPIFLDRIFVVAGAKDHPWPFTGARECSACEACIRAPDLTAPRKPPAIKAAPNSFY
ncbi:hypothetical protein ABTN33_19795, partial [Acinetobacter baumannii]